MATTASSTTVLAGLADIRGWQEEFYRDLNWRRAWRASPRNLRHPCCE
jgi:hypothetical protein